MKTLTHGEVIFDDEDFDERAPAPLPGGAATSADTAANRARRERLLARPETAAEERAAAELRAALVRASASSPDLGTVDRGVAVATSQEGPVNRRIGALEREPASPERDHALRESLLELAWIYHRQGRFRAALSVCPLTAEYDGHRRFFREYVEAQARPDDERCSCQGETAKAIMALHPTDALSERLHTEQLQHIVATGPSDTHGGPCYHIRCSACGHLQITPHNLLA